MSDGAYAEVILVADRDLHVKAVEACLPAGCPHLSEDPRPDCRVGLRLPECVDGIDADEVERICLEILSGKHSPNGGRCFRRVVNDPETPGRRWVIALGPVAGKNGAVDGIVYAKLRADVSPDQLSSALDSGDLYETLVQNAGDIIFLLDADGVITFLNRRVEDYTELSPELLIGKHFSSIVHPDDREACEAVIERTFRTCEAVRDFSFRARLPGGTVRYLVASGRCVKTAASDRLVGVCRDVTESVELHSELVARNEVLSAINAVVLSISGERSLQEGLRSALRRIVGAVGAQGGAVLLRDESGCFRLAVHEGFEGVAPEELIHSLGEQLGKAFEELGDPVYVPDVASSDILSDDLKEMLLSLGIASGAGIPLKCSEKVTAVLAVALPMCESLSVVQSELLGLVGRILGPPIENARLRADLADQVNRLALLERMARSISTGRDVYGTLNTCVREIAGLIDYEYAAVVLTDSGGRSRLYPFARNGWPLPEGRFDTPLGWLEEIVLSREPVVIADGSGLEVYHSVEHFNPENGSGAVAPLVFQDEPLGLLKLWSNKPNAFGARELAILSAAAEHLAIAVSNARLYEAERERALELRALAKEAQHRIKNNLQMISGLLGMSGRDAGEEGRLLSRCQRQINAIAAVNELLTLDNADATVSLLACLTSVAESAVTATGRKDDIRLTVTGEDLILKSDDATALGVIVNELVTNAVVHGLENRENGNVTVTVARRGGRRVVEVADDGMGLPSHVRPSHEQSPSSGLELVASLAEHGLGGELEIECSGGTKIRVVF